MTRDPSEGVGPDGRVVTGVDPANIVDPYDAVVESAVEAVVAQLGDALDGLYIYGSVATGMARPPTSDVDLYAIVLRDAGAASREAASDLSARYAPIVREVGVSAVLLDDVLADTLEGWAERCFVRHYCVHLAGRNRKQDLPACQASPALARGVNGNVGDAIGRSLNRLRSEVLDERRTRHAIAWSARKLLMSAATLLSTRAGGWTTDRDAGARLLTTAAPQLSTCVRRVQRWTKLDTSESHTSVPPLDEVLTCLAELRDWLASEYEKIPASEV